MVFHKAWACLFILCVAEGAGATSCLQRILGHIAPRRRMLEPGPSPITGSVNSLSRRSPAIRDLFERIRSQTNGLSVQRDPARVRTILAQVDDPGLRRGVAEAVEKMHDQGYIATRMEQLAADVLEHMLRSGDATLVAKAEAGVLDHASTLAVLRARASARGVPVVQVDSVVSAREFNRRIGQGFIIDNNANIDNFHGGLTHFIQQDMVYDVIAQTGRVSYQDIMQLLGTRRGMVLWDNMFDSDSLASAMSPEHFNQTVLRHFIPKR